VETSQPRGKKERRGRERKASFSKGGEVRGGRHVVGKGNCFEVEKKTVRKKVPLLRSGVGQGGKALGLRGEEKRRLSETMMPVFA